ncbi:MAG: amidase [Gammaproteobacteria bacterium]|nr:amidase [Gammaproteobacteria bacterium]
MVSRRSFLGAGIGATTLLAGGSLRADAPDPADLGLRDAALALQQRRLSPVDLTRACLARIARLDPLLNTFITVTGEQALERARELEAARRRGGEHGPLHGIPVALKDNVDTAGVRTTAAAAAFATRVPTADAEVTRRLLAAGAIVLGKLNMDECAYGVTSTTGHFGAVRNPWATEFVAGGSSGGPAAAVAAGLCYGAIGTDTGGSIRQPAAFCGVTGLKASHGLVSARGVVPLAWSLDHVGPLGRSAADVALLLQAIAGYDAGDPASIEGGLPDYTAALDESTRGLHLGLPRQPFFEALDGEIAIAVEEALRVLATLTQGTRDVTLPAVPALAVMFVEAHAHFAPLLAASPQGFSPALRGLVAAGARIDAASYAQALRQLALVRHEAAAVFRDVDLLVTPTTPVLPERIGAAGATAPVRGPPPSARNTAPFNVFGLPTISIPCGVNASGLPIGLQITGPPRGEARVLALAHAFQKHTAWHRRRPPASHPFGG